MPTYRTPDVYVEEISVFPPSVAEVETAIPAFVGYTAKATRAVDGDLKNVPTRIVSLLEFEGLFGGAPRLDVARVNLDDASNFVDAQLGAGNTKYLYSSLRLFFDNGGGPCHIVSVGLHSAATDKDELIAGLRRVSTVDEPTMLVVPDAAALSADDLAAVQMEALDQCGKLGDRVAILDTALYTNKTDHAAAIASFRGKNGVNNLKYGAAYAPWLKLKYPKNVGYADLAGKLFKGGAPVSLTSLSGDAGLNARMALLDSVIADGALITATLSGLASPQRSLAAHQDKLLTDYQGGKSETTTEALFGSLTGLAHAIDGLLTAVTKLANPSLTAFLTSQISGSLKAAYTRMIAVEKELAAAAGTYTEQWSIGTAPSAAAWGDIFGANDPDAGTGTIPTAPATPLAAQLDAALPTVHATFAAASTALGRLSAEAATWRSNHEDYLTENFSAYRAILRGVNGLLTACPPCGAVSGVYARVDNQRGVWKAPANVSLTGVIEPTYYFDSDDTDNLNIDPVAGKSVNAIRSFVGKGTLIWGARTLAGNDNEWRYISVRRFFNMVEESVKKSTYWAVFEPNDANTWVKVRGMIESYLTQKWREGALAGSTTKEAFFVRCGLGTTMSSQDILEGRMYVEIGMAVVRPAEFIILKFYHKLQTS